MVQSRGVHFLLPVRQDGIYLKTIRGHNFSFLYSKIGEILAIGKRLNDERRDALLLYKLY